MTRAERKARRRQMAERIAGGESIADVCRAFDVSDSTVHVACAEWGVKPPAVEHHRRPMLLGSRSLSLIAELLNTDRSFTEIAAKHGLSKARVSDLAQRCISSGIEIPPRRRGKARLATDRGPSSDGCC